MRFKRLHPAAQLPKRQNTGDAGYDLHALRDTSIEHLSIIETGVAVAIPEGYVGIIKDRSGMAAKIGAHTLAGVIDSGDSGSSTSSAVEVVSGSAGGSWAQPDVGSL